MLGKFDRSRFSDLSDYIEASSFIIAVMKEIEADKLKVTDEEWQSIRIEVTSQVIQTLSFLFSMSNGNAEQVQVAIFNWAQGELKNQTKIDQNDPQSDEIDQIRAKLEEIFNKNG